MWSSISLHNFHPDIDTDFAAFSIVTDTSDETADPFFMVEANIYTAKAL